MPPSVTLNRKMEKSYRGTVVATTNSLCHFCSGMSKYWVSLFRPWTLYFTKAVQTQVLSWCLLPSERSVAVQGCCSGDLLSLSGVVGLVYLWCRARVGLRPHARLGGVCCCPLEPLLSLHQHPYPPPMLHGYQANLHEIESKATAKESISSPESQTFVSLWQRKYLKTWDV